MRLPKSRLGALAHALHEALENGALQLAACRRFAEALRLVAEQRRGGQRDAERRVDLMRHAGHELAERGELFRLDQVGLRLLQLRQRRVGAVLGFSQRLLAAADLGDEDVRGARHVAELVAAIEIGDRAGAGVLGELRHAHAAGGGAAA